MVTAHFIVKVSSASLASKQRIASRDRLHIQNTSGPCAREASYDCWIAIANQEAIVIIAFRSSLSVSQNVSLFILCSYPCYGSKCNIITSHARLWSGSTLDRSCLIDLRLEWRYLWWLVLLLLSFIAPSLHQLLGEFFFCHVTIQVVVLKLNMDLTFMMGSVCCEILSQSIHLACICCRINRLILYICYCYSCTTLSVRYILFNVIIAWYCFLATDIASKSFLWWFTSCLFITDAFLFRTE